jgi:KipI family sensor histidine kinase inhibitor
MLAHYAARSMGVSWLSDTAMVVGFEGASANATAIAAWRALAADPPWEVIDIIPAASSVTVVIRPGMEPGPRVRAWAETSHEPSSAEGAEHVIDAVYDGDDLDEVARLSGIGVDQVVWLHSQATYTVAFVGFSPGFAYLHGLPEALHVARLDTPRTRVPAGSIAIGGRWTGVYPTSTPGGWRLIGRTAATLFDVSHGASLQPGDRVRFAPA